ncbi:MAG: tetratricopeptide repeat protein [Candidatus Sericytochromatia bacterium]
MRHSIHSVFYDQAEAHEAGGRYEDALALYYQVHRWASADADLWLRMGVLSFLTTDAGWLQARGLDGSHVGDMGAVNADVYLSRAVELAPDHAPARFWRGWVRHRLFGDTEGAVTDLAVAVRERPQFAYAQAALGRIELRREGGEAGVAAERLKLAIASLPESGRLHYDMGACLARLEQRDAAREAFRQAVRCGGLAVPTGVGGRHLGEEFHAAPGAIAELVQRYYADIVM